MATAIGWVGRRARALGWYVTSLMGDGAYGTYVAHQRSRHPEQQPMGERAFWIERYREQDANPGSRCC